MKTRFKVGDKVRFLNETGGGLITRIDEKGLLFVEAEEGFEIPVLSSDVIPAGGFDTMHLEHGNGQAISSLEAKREYAGVKTKPPASPNISLPINAFNEPLPVNVVDNPDFNVILGFVPEQDGPVFSSHIHCYLINDSEYCIFYRMGTLEQGILHHLSSGMIEANTKYLIITYNQTDLSKISGMHLQVLWLSEGRYASRPVVDRMIALGGVNFSKESYYFENEYFENKAVLFPALDTEQGKSWSAKPGKQTLSGLKQEMTHGDHVIRSAKRPVNDTMEVDLHIESIAGDKNMHTAAEILALQLKRLDESMREAISKKMRRLVIIHGVGQGTLKMQIRRELQEKYPEYQFQDASFREYGFGATLVHLHTIRKQ